MERHQKSKEKKPPSTGVRILSICGGGMRGILALQILMALEQRLGSSILDHFDLICGTSIGGIIAMYMIFVKKTAKEAEEFLKDIGSSIFGSNKAVELSRFSSKAECFSSAQLERRLQQTFTKLKLNAIAYPKMFVVSTDCSFSRPDVFLFRNYPANQSNYNGTKEAFVWQAARATSAAPVYFQEYSYKTSLDDLLPNYLTNQMRSFNDTTNNVRLLRIKMENIRNNTNDVLVTLKDGGLLANNPVQLALNEARRIWPDTKVDYIISIGTGTTADVKESASSKTNPSSAVSKVLEEILEIATSSELIHQNFITNNSAEGFAYHRLSVPLPFSIDLSACDNETISLMRDLAAQYIKTNSQFIDEVVSLLKKNE